MKKKVPWISWEREQARKRHKIKETKKKER
jgi:hypothetical protein